MSELATTGHASTCPLVGEACAGCQEWACRTSEALARRLLELVTFDEGPDRPVARLESFDAEDEDRR